MNMRLSKVLDDRYEIQEAVFLRWADSFSPGTVKDLSDVVDPKFLFLFAKLIVGETLTSSGSRAQDILNTLRLIDGDERINQVNINELIDGNARTICSLIWQLMQIFWRRFAPAEIRDQKLTEGLKNWCFERAQRLEVLINDFISSWRDGYALNAILLSYNSELFDMDEIRDMRAEERIEHAMGLAERHLNVPRLLHPKEFHSEHLDSKSVICYLMVLYLSLTRQAVLPKLQPELHSQTQLQPRLHSPEPLEHSTNRSTSRPQKPTSQNVAVKSDHEMTADLLIPLLETSYAKLEYPKHASPEEAVMRSPSVGTARRHSLPHLEIVYFLESTETPSRKSSTSTQKSSRRRSKAMEETIAEFEECLEHVLSWLLEAEEQANCMEPIEKNDVEQVKKQFKEHESFMQSLTESQDSVGRVLHRGQTLVQKLEEEQATTIVSQLLMVNSRWERVREVAMTRQNELQHCLNSLQVKQLESIREWLDKMEESIHNAPLLTLNSDQADQLVKVHADIQKSIENEQKVVQGLSTFVAVVDESDTYFSYENLEKLLQSVGQRWMNVCEWAEMRALHLNGLSELITEYKRVYEKICEWLDRREEDLTGLQLSPQLEQENEVIEQVSRLQKLESSLEEGHPDFLALSQLAVELLAKIEQSNESEANQIRQQMETITKRWDMIVAHIDECSHVLVKSGKAEAREFIPQYVERESDSGDNISTDAVEMSKHSTSTVQFTSYETVISDPATSPSTCQIISPVDKFIANVKRVSEELQPLVDWTYQFKITRDPEQVRNVIQICQAKLGEIKEKEAKVNELHAELERIHNQDISSAQLHLANDTFDKFTLMWSRIVSKVSDTLNSLSTQSNLAGTESEDEIERIVNTLNEFFEKAEHVVSNCAQIPTAERQERVAKLQNQLLEQDKNIKFLQATHSNKEQVESLKKRFWNLNKSVNELAAGKDAIIGRFEGYLRTTFPCAGDIESFVSELERYDNLLRELENCQLENEKIEQLKKLGSAKRESLADYLERSRRNDIKAAESEKLLSTLTDRFANLKTAKLEVPELYKHFVELQNDIQKSLAVQKESLILNEEIMSIALSSSASNRERIFQKLKTRMQITSAGWSTLEDDIDESMALLEKECKRLQQSAIREFQQNIEELRCSIKESRDATDAEEFSEHLDNLERLCEAVQTADKNLINLSNLNERLTANLENICEERDKLLIEAKNRIDELQTAIRNCEQFDSSLTECQAWCNHVQLILSCRAANDVSALDVPHEYKNAFASGTLISQLQKEFDDFEHCIRNLREFVIKNTSDWGSPNRLQLQLDHITVAHLNSKLVVDLNL
ncbi:unnamed protein product [Thelazia callipaeda]|uniref:Calponin-homology (CH) domain-containing protein n=1 Tax=Thelazia callipaeda TaxID=103827 RepID=A0A158RCW2_THECL|nr:unnamed protein product [Thelazia callipaeda]